MTTKPIPTRLKPAEFETKWQKTWEEKGTYRPDIKNPKKPYFNLMMFPYPSAEGLHVGNMYAFTGVDVHGRFMRQRGYDVFEPIGLDGFGIHSENYAMKVGRKPQEHAKVSEKNFYRQLRATGNGFDWTRTVETYDPDYYRWTQWLFVQMFTHGLAYRAKATVNWCPGCKTVLADEQVIDGKCERCSSIVTKKALEQWFFRITDYAERLLQNTYKPEFKWPDKVKIGQRNWIGKKEGINITYPIAGSKKTITVWTSRPDTNFGATFIVISPEYAQIQEVTTEEQKKVVKEYIEKSKKISKEDRIAAGRKKTGVFTGSFAINHLTGDKMPIWVADFVLADVGTGAVVGVPGHDLRDFEFAKEFDLPIKRVVVGLDGDTSAITKPEQVQEEVGTMVNSDFLNDLDIHEATTKVMNYIEEKGWGKRTVSYHLRDWLISRQRYWGAPIPMIYCEACAKAGKSYFDTEKEVKNVKNKMTGWFPVAEEQLPVKLPEVDDWRPEGTGRGPLAGHPEFYKTECPNCGGSATRETDVCDTFLDSAWYYLRYPNVGLSDADLSRKGSKILPWNVDINRQWMPVDSYIGGAEHTVLHLLYTRFTYMALKDWGYLETKQPTKTDTFDPEEPFKRFYAHGLIIKDGAKMSKSKGNVVVPDDYIKLYGSDTLRTYLMFLGPFDQGGDFRDSGIAGMYKWLSRVWRLVHESANPSSAKSQSESPEGLKLLHKTIKGVTEDMNELHYNTVISKLMIFTNWWMEHSAEVSKETVVSFLKLLAPFAPHMSEELYQNVLKQSSLSIHLDLWPEYDSTLVVEDTNTIVIQINGKVRDSIVVSAQEAKNREVIEQRAKASATMKKWLSEGKILKVIFVPGKIINFVVTN